MMPEPSEIMFLTQMVALAPLCKFEKPEELCDEEELFYRRLYAWRRDDALTAMKRKE